MERDLAANQLVHAINKIRIYRCHFLLLILFEILQGRIAVLRTVK